MREKRAERDLHRSSKRAMKRVVIDRIRSSVRVKKRVEAIDLILIRIQFLLKLRTRTSKPLLINLISNL